VCGPTTWLAGAVSTTGHVIVAVAVTVTVTVARHRVDPIEKKM